MRLACLLLRVLLVLSLFSTTATAGPPDAIANSVARIFVVKTVGWLDQPPISVAALDSGHGSGTIISRDGLVLTAQHVIDGAMLVTVFPPGATQPVPATVAYENKELDFAILIIGGDHPQFTPLPKVPPKPASLQHFNVAGYPLRAQQATALWFDGKVSGPVTGTVARWEVGTQFNGGLSGGPVFDDSWTLMGIAVQGGNVQAGVSGVGRFVAMGPILADYSRNAAGDIAAKRAEHDATNTPVARELATLATTLVLDSASSHARGQLSALESGNLVPELATLADRTSRPEVKLLVAAMLWNAARGKVIDAGATTVDGIANTEERERVVKAIDLLVRLCTEIERDAPSVAARSIFVREVLVAERRVRPRSCATVFMDTDGQQVSRGETIRLPAAGFSVNVPDGGWRFRACPNEEQFKPVGRDEYLVVSIVPQARPCIDAANAVAWSDKRFVRSSEPFDTKLVQTTSRIANVCVRLRGGAALLVTGNLDAPDTARLVSAIGRGAVDEIGKWEEPPVPFNPKRELSIVRPELALLSLVGPGIDTGWGGTLGFRGLASVFDSWDTSTAELAFAHGGRGAIGYESHNMVVFDGFYGFGFAVRVWHVALAITGGAGMDVLDGGHETVVVGGKTQEVASGFTVPFAFDLGFDARVRGWPSHRLGFEVGGGWLKRAPDELAKWVTRNILLDGHVLVRVTDGFVMSAGLDYVNREVAHEVRTVLGFGF